ncbi:hypothetical protein OG453_02160 [Streptomyces sp. NBC_01381]|uniref:hypothetical protein n=1 Tax=unclassified Streptomyces TaxID=2593676 RepID=UPI00107E6C58|nr:MULTISPECIES: hypothetical protein [unclassified Streptomyces]MCX4665487.1 hypothetical protein [Streptomyces sp. NBC_01381]TGB01555.1 hypothetical protein E2651_27620 [Streptomyces sp. MZ04]
MGWTHDYSDAARNRRSATALNSHEGGGPHDPGHEGPAQGIGIPRILRRRARWVSARLRHTRD